MLNQRMSMLLISLIFSFVQYQRPATIFALDCNISLDDVVEIVPSSLSNIISGLVVFDTQFHAYKSLGAKVPLYTPTYIENYYRSGVTKLAPSGTFAFTPYNDTDGNLKLYFAELLPDSTSHLIIDNPMWYDNSFGSPYWLDSSVTVVPVRISATEYMFDLIKLPSGEQSEIIVHVDNDLPSPHRIPVLSPDMTKVAYISLSNSSDTLVIVDIVQQTVLLEVEFPYIDSVGLIKWSPNSSFLAFQHNEVDDSYITVITSDGEELAKAQVELRFVYPTSDFQTFQWSPDGTHLIFTNQENEKIWSQIVLNVSTDEYTKVCIPSEALFAAGGEYIFFVGFDIDSDGVEVSRLFLYDLHKEIMYDIDYPDLSEIGSALGWVNPIR